MKAIFFSPENKTPQLSEREIPRPGKGESLIRLHYASLNHLDLWIWQEQSLPAPVVSGADGSGIVQAVGDGVPAGWIGKEVLINPSMYWGDDERTYGSNYRILGNRTNGTFAEYITVPQEYIHEKPAHLSLREAAALPMAALTAYRALFTKAQLQAGDKVLLTGIGGGVALFALQMAVAAGASAYITSSSNDKIEQGLSLGAKAGFNYNDAHWMETAKEVAGGFDVIIDSAGGNGFSALTEVANAAARIVLLGRTAGAINNLKPGIIFNKQLCIAGTVMGTPGEFAQMLRFFSHHQLRPVISAEFHLAQIKEAVAALKSGENFGKLLFKIQP